MHGVEVVVGEEQRHQVALFQADAVLAGDGAAHFDAELHHFVGGGDDAGELLRVAGVKEDGGVEVAVAGVEDVADLEAVAGGDFVHRAQRLRQLGARDDAVLGVVVGREAAHGAEGVLASLPEFFALGLGAGAAHFAHAVGAAELFDLIGLRFDGFAQTFEFNQEHGGGVERVAGVGGGFDRLEAEAVEHFAGGRGDAAGGEVGDGFSGVVHGVEDGQQSFDRFRQAGEADGDFGDDGERALRANQQAGEVVAGQVGHAAADWHQLAGGQHDFQAEDVIAGDAVGEGVGAAGVFGHVAADGASLLAGRVGGELVAVGRDRLGQVEVDHAGLDHGAPVGQVDFQDAFHAAEDHQQAAFGGERAAGESGAGAAADQRDFKLVGQADDAHHVFRAARKDHRVGQGAVGAGVVFVEQQLLRAVEDAIFAEDFLEFLDELPVFHAGLW